MTTFSITLKGISWMTALRGLTRIVLFVRIAALARILTPRDFGVFGIAALVLAFLEIITETGINVFLLQKKEIEKYLESAWLISIIRGFVIGLLIYVSVEPVSTFFKSPDVRPLLYLAVLLPVIRGFINPASVKFQKELFFDREFTFRMSLVVVETLATIYFAFINASAISLILGMLVSAIFEVLVSFIFIKPRPKLAIDTTHVKEIVVSGKWITGYGVFNYLFTQGDNVVVGRILGESPLGLYQNAYKISTLPLSEVNDIFYRATFPVYAKMSDRPKELKEIVKKHFLVVSLLLLTGGIVLYLFATQIVLVILGPNWIAAIPLVKALSFLGVIRGISFSFNSLFLALQKQHYVTYVTLVSFLGLAITIVPMVRIFGTVGGAYSAMIGSIIAFPLALYFIRKTFRSLN